MGYKVRFVNYPLHYQNIKEEVDAAIEEVLLNGDFILRGQLEQFENNMASFLGVKHTIGVNSGTDALYLSAIAAGLKAGDEVITVAHTFVATIGAIVNCGATPILVDVGDDHNMDVAQLEQAISSRTRAIIPVHLNGYICNMEKVMEIAEKHNLIVIEDAAQALGATFNSKKAGSFGLSGCFSFYPAKMLGTVGDGGLVATNDDEFAKKIRVLRDNGRTETGDMNGYGFCSRLDNIHAAILDVKLNHFPEWVNRRREIAQLYYDGLSDLPDVKLPPQLDERYFTVYQNFVIRSDKRDELVAHLRDSGVEILISWPKPLNKQETLKLEHFNLPMTEQLSNEVLSLPMYPELSDEEVGFVIDAIHKFYKK